MIAGMRFRKLRIAWSVLWGAVAVLVCVLWVAHRKSRDWIAIPMSHESGVVFFSGTGRVAAALDFGGGIAQSDILQFFLAEECAPGFTSKSELLFPEISVFQKDDGLILLAVPNWQLVALSVSVATVPWLRWRFSLRTLLIATAVVAVGLGMVVWLAR